MREYSISHFDFPGSDGLPGEAAPKNVSDGAASPLRDPDTPSQVGMRSRFYQHALDEAAVVAVTDRKGTIVSVNRKFCDLSGYSREELIGQNHRVLKSGRHDRAFFHQLYHTISQGGVWHGEICNRAKNGGLYWVDTTIVPYRGADGEIERYIAIRFDITRQKMAEDRLWHLANFDPLTGLPNRLWFMNEIKDCIHQGLERIAPFAIAMLDLDNFKDINDSLGHAAGDSVLRAVGDRCRAAIRNGDCIARIGGDEFAIIMHDCGDPKMAMERADTLLRAITPPVHVKGSDRTICASIGIAIFPRDGWDQNELLKCADIALYSVKSNGRARSALFDSEMRQAVLQRARIRADFETALHTGQLRVFYQPIIESEGRSPIAMEALLRWQHPRDGLISAAAFADALIEESLAARADMFVLRTVIGQIRAWRDAAVPFRSISINATIADFRSSDYVDLIIEAVETGMIDRRDICVEINEDTLLGSQQNEAILQISRLHDAGVGTAFDDFGTGFASLRHLRDIPVDTVKIDKSFIDSVETKPSDCAIVTSVIELAHRLGKKVTAEGVETLAQADILQRLHCDSIQGYLVAPAMDNTMIERFIGDIEV